MSDELFFKITYTFHIYKSEVRDAVVFCFFLVDWRGKIIVLKIESDINILHCRM